MVHALTHFRMHNPGYNWLARSGSQQEALRGLGLLWESNQLSSQAQGALEQARDLNSQNPLVHLALGEPV